MKSYLPEIQGKEITLQALFKMLAEPVLMVLMLVILSQHFNQTLDEKYYLIAILIFAVSFPGTWHNDKSIKDLFVSVFSDWLVVVGVVTFLGYFTNYLGLFPKQMIYLWMCMTPSAIFILQVVVNSYLKSRAYREKTTRDAIIVGVNQIGMQLKTRMLNDAELALRFNGFFDDRSIQRLTKDAGLDEALKGMIAEVPDYVRKHNIDVIYIALPMTMQPRVHALLDSLKDTTVSIYFVPDIFVFDLIQARIDDVGGIPVVAVCETPFTGINAIIKRGSDIVFSIMILTLILPVLAAVALAIKLTSKGPIIFKQKRYGLDAEEITVYKFRSMTVEENGDAVKQATKNDMRITPLGKILRRTSLDELPQFINVLQGRMSIVGPRPHAVAHNEMYRKVIKGYMIRHKVKPGITGLAQINGFRGETETVDKMAARIEYDLEYLRRWTLMLDIHIILRTVVLVFKDQNAY